MSKYIISLASDIRLSPEQRIKMIIALDQISENSAIWLVTGIKNK